MNNEDIFETDNFVTIQNICAKAKEKRRMYGLIGYTGAGKTKGLKYYKSNHKNVFYTTLGKSSGVRKIYIDILHQLGLGGVSPNVPIGFILNKLAENLNMSNSSNLIIIDEAGKSRPDQLEHLHDLRNRTEKSTGIVIAGPGYFHTNVQSWSESDVIGIPEFESRVYDWEYLAHPTKRETYALCKEYGIIDKKTQNQIFNCKVPNNFRTIFNEIEKELERRAEKAFV